MRASIGHPNHDGLADLLGPRRATAAAGVRDDQRAVVQCQLGAMIRPDTYPFDEGERLLEPIDGLADIRVGQHRDNGRGGNRAIGPHTDI
jgi:hypothetical protein